MNFSINIKWLLLLTSTVILIIAPDLAAWLTHLFFKFLHVLFGFIEVILHKIVEHLFHTDHRTTQIIVFYLILAMFLPPAYLLFHCCKKRVIELKKSISCWYKNKNEIAKISWQQQSILKKCKFITGCFLGMLGFSYLVF